MLGVLCASASLRAFCHLCIRNLTLSARWPAGLQACWQAAWREGQARLKNVEGELGSCFTSPIHNRLIQTAFIWLALASFSIAISPIPLLATPKGPSQAQSPEGILWLKPPTPNKSWGACQFVFGFTKSQQTSTCSRLGHPKT